MKWIRRTALGVLAVQAGLLGGAACGNSSPTAPAATTFTPASAAASAMTGSRSTPSIPVARSTGPAGSSPGLIAASNASATSSAALAPATSGAASSPQREVNPAGDIPDNQAFVTYAPSAGKFTVTVPEGWARTDTATGVLFTDKYNSIRVETRKATSAPTPASIRSTEVPALAGSAPNFQLGSVTMVSRNAGAAVLLTYHADTAPNAVTGRVTTAAFERYALFRAGTEVAITVGAPVGGDNVDPWRTVTDSFSWAG